jgi:hypothetical protein
MFTNKEDKESAGIKDLPKSAEHLEELLGTN